MKRPGGFDAGPPAEHPPEEARTPRAPIALPIVRLSRRARASDAADAVEPIEEVTAPVEDTAVAATDVADLVASDDDATVPLDDAVGELRVAESGTERAADVRDAQRRLRHAERARRRRERGEQRRFTAHLRQRRRVWLSVLGAVVGLALFVAVGVLTPLMAVREIRIDGAAQVNVDDLTRALTRFEGVPLALVNDQEVHDALTPFPLIERYAIERIPPHTLVLVIEERDAVIAIERDGAFALYDPAGVLVGSATERPQGVPLAAGSVLDTSSEAFAAAARVIRDVPADVRAEFVAVEAASPEELVWVLASGTRVTWGGADQTQRKAVVLRAMIASLENVASIDVSAPDSPVFT